MSELKEITRLGQMNCAGRSSVVARTKKERKDSGKRNTSIFQATEAGVGTVMTCTKVQHTDSG